MKRIISIFTLLSITLSALVANASVLGSEVVYTSTEQFAEGTYFTKNIFYSDQSTVGNQTEYYFEYTPNDTVKPAIINGASLYGKRTIKDMATQMQNDGVFPVMLINADFFSLETGVPMSDCVSYGEIITKGGVGTDAIGINEDGTAFMAWLHLYTTITVGDSIINADIMNKYRQPYSLYMLTDKFGEETYAKGEGTNVIIGELSDTIQCDNTVTGVVEQVIHADGSIPIPKGKIVLTLDDRADEEKQNQIALFQEGAEVTITTQAQGDARWADAKYIMGSTGGRIIVDGKITDVDQSAAPRSAVGITEEGNLLFYALDGRQAGHSYGARIETLAKRLKELGCVDAINLDGGGSTSVMGMFPGHTNPILINSPSDGSMRPVANFFALINTKEASGKLDYLTVYPFTGHYLVGTSEEITVMGTDTHSHAVSTGKVDLSCTNGELDGSAVHFTQQGKVNVTAKSGNIEDTATYYAYNKPTSIDFINKSTNKKITNIRMDIEESVSLKAKAYNNHTPLIDAQNLYSWSADEEIGTITSDGVFTSGQKSATGNIYVTAGETTCAIPVTIKDSSDLYDQEKHTQVEVEYSDGLFTAKIMDNETFKVERSGIKVTIDGAVTDEFDYTEGVISITFDDSLHHKIKLEIFNIYERTNIFTYTIDGEITNDKFSDIEGHWAQSYIKYMNNNGVVNGVPTPAGFDFLPGNNITRGEFAVMTANFLGINPEEYADVSLPYADLDKIPDWSINQIKAMYKMGIITGKSNPDGTVTYESTAPITRCEVAVILSRILPETSVMIKPSASDYSEVPTWATAGIDKACGAGIISGYEDGTIKPLNNVTRAEAVKMFYSMF